MKDYSYKWRIMLYSILIVIILLSLLLQVYTINTENFDSTRNYMEGVDIIYWINLDRSPERRGSMETMFSDPVFNDTPNHRIPAIDGKNVDVFSYFEPSQRENPKLNNVEYACLISHLEMIRTFSESNYNVAIMMEDDMTLEFQDYWKKTVNEIIQEAPLDWDVIQLCYNSNMEPNTLYDFNRPCAGAYIISKKGAIRLMELKENGIYNLGKHSRPPYLHADHFIFSYLKTYCYKYPMFIYKDDNDSLLHPGDLSDHKRSKQNIVKMYKMYNAYQSLLLSDGGPFSPLVK